jgi:hypothetical protein
MDEGLGAREHGMSRSVDLFVGTDRDLEDVAGAVGAAVGADAVPSPDGAGWSFGVGEVRATLGPSHYVDDGDLLLGRYRYVVSCEVGFERRLADAPETALLRAVSDSLRDTGMATLLVHDLQYRDGEQRGPDGSGPPGDEAA